MRAGKSTITKLLAPLSPNQNRDGLSSDGYDINKVELYSLRRQIGMVLEETYYLTVRYRKISP
ncbi:MAG UNVERIFIED_CONTAM: hypothetical protein LVR29_05660 [Microcystis novacekii LVE1205-3]